MRSRNRYLSHSMAKTTLINANGVVTSLGTFPANRKYETIIDQVTPGYFRRVGRHGLPQNPLTYTCQTVSEQPGRILFPDASPPPVGFYIDGSICQYLNTPGALGTPAIAAYPSYDVATMTAKAKSKCLARFDRPNYSFGEPIAELKHTVQTVKDPFTTVNKLLTRFHKERLSKPETYVAGSKDLANLWAGYSFGIGPLIGSAVDAVEAYRQRNAVRFRYETIYASERLSDKADRYTSSLSYGGWISTRRGTRSLSVTVKAGVFYSVMDAGTRGTLLGLRARDLPGVAWELVPLSFMVDRIINVKRFINASTSLLSNNVNVLGGFVSTRIATDVEYQHCDIRVGTSQNRKTVPSDSPICTVSNFSLGRTKWNPSVADVWPRFENRLFSDIHSTLDVISIVLGKLKIPVSISHWSKKHGYRQRN